jgi:hypothetical protein
MTTSKIVTANRVRFVPQVLDVVEDGALSKKLGKAVHAAVKAGEWSRGSIAELLAGRVDPMRLPTWVAFDGGGDLNHIVRLVAPMFVARGADEDEFYHDPGGAQLVVGQDGAGTRVTRSGNATEIDITTVDIPKLTAYDAGGFCSAICGGSERPRSPAGDGDTGQPASDTNSHGARSFTDSA